MDRKSAIASEAMVPRGRLTEMEVGISWAAKVTPGAARCVSIDGVSIECILSETVLIQFWQSVAWLVLARNVCWSALS